MLTRVSRPRMLTVLFTGALLVAVGLIYFRNADFVSGPVRLVGSHARSFTLPATHGPNLGIASERGSIVVLNLWASWCPPCRAEMPDLQRFWLAQRTHGVVVIGVDEGESATAATTFARALGVTYPILVDSDQRYGRVYSALGLPTTTVIDRNGIVRAAFDGPVTESQLAVAIHGL